jgi:hypothetical protein
MKTTTATPTAVHPFGRNGDSGKVAMGQPEDGYIQTFSRLSPF